MIEPQSCGLPDGGVAYLNGQAGSVVMFHQYGPGETEAATVVECQSRQALTIQISAGRDRDAFWDAEGLIADAVYDDEEQTLEHLEKALETLPLEVEDKPLSHPLEFDDLPEVAKTFEFSIMPKRYWTPLDVKINLPGD